MASAFYWLKKGATTVKESELMKIKEAALKRKREDIRNTQYRALRKRGFSSTAAYIGANYGKVKFKALMDEGPIDDC